jgi:hypothetical protein
MLSLWQSPRMKDVENVVMAYFKVRPYDPSFEA